MVSGRGFRAVSVFQSIPKLIGQRAKGGPGSASAQSSKGRAWFWGSYGQHDIKAGTIGFFLPDARC